MTALLNISQLEAENAYRRERITHDWAAANGTQRALVRRLRRLARWASGAQPIGTVSEDALGLESRAWLARARAEELMFSHPDDPDLPERWTGVVALFDEAELRYDAMRARERAAVAHVLAGATERARATQQEAGVIAGELGLTAAVLPKPADGVTLTPREREVLALVADGRTNGEIAATLFISTKTASVHVSNILAKLGAARRAEAAAIALRDGLI